MEQVKKERKAEKAKEGLRWEATGLLDCGDFGLGPVIEEEETNCGIIIEEKNKREEDINASLVGTSVFGGEGCCPQEGDPKKGTSVLLTAQ